MPKSKLILIGKHLILYGSEIWKFGPAFCLSNSYFTDGSLDLFALFISVNMTCSIVTIGQCVTCREDVSWAFCTEKVFNFLFQKRGDDSVCKTGISFPPNISLRDK